jgi:hypothetical protein
MPVSAACSPSARRRPARASAISTGPIVVDWNEGLLAVLVPDEADETAAFHLRRLREHVQGRCYLALTLRRRPNDQLRFFDLSNLAAPWRSHRRHQ